MLRQILTYFSGSVVPLVISALFFFEGRSGAGALCLAIGLTAVYLTVYRSARSPYETVLGRSVWGLLIGSLTLVWMGMIFYLSSLTQSETPVIPLVGSWQSLVGHLVLFGICAALIEGSIWGWVSEIRLRWALAAGVAATAYGISDEIHQSFVDGRHATVEDALVNAVAAIVAAVGLWMIAARRTRGGNLARRPDSLEHRR